MNKDNLLVLADYLDALPANYSHFDMNSFLWTANTEPWDPSNSPNNVGKLGNCGTTACAIGHGPAAGFPVLPGDKGNWFNYCRRVFGTTLGEVDGDFMFGEHNGGDHYDAARRIRETVKGA